MNTKYSCIAQYPQRMTCVILLAGLVFMLMCGHVTAMQTGRVGVVTVNRSSVPSQQPVQPEISTAPEQTGTNLPRLLELSPPRPSTIEESSHQQPRSRLAELAPPVAQQSSKTNASRTTTTDQKATTNRSANTSTGTSLKPAEKQVEPKVETSDVATDKNTAAIQEAMKAYQNGKSDQAKTILLDLYKNNSDFPPPGIVLAQFASNTQQVHQIRRWLDQAAWEQPEDPEAFFLLANFALMENRLTETLLLVEKGVAALGNLPESGKRRPEIALVAESIQGRLYQMRQEWDASRQHFEIVAEMEPENFDVLARLGMVAAHQEKYDDAIAFFQKANEKGGNLPTPKLIVSQIADQLGKTDVAKKYFDEVINAADLDPESIRIAVQIQLRQGNISEADKFLAKAVKADPNNIDNRIFAGTIALFKKDYPAAEKQFQDAILISPNNYVAVHGLALALAEQEGTLKKERALAYAKNNVQNSGESPDSVATLAWVYFKSDKMIEAEHLVNLVLASGEVSPLNAYFLAEIAAATGQKEKALSLVRMANTSKENFVKKSEAEALQKKLEAEADAPAPLQTTEKPQEKQQTAVKTQAKPTETNSQTKTPVRFPGTGK